MRWALLAYAVAACALAAALFAYGGYVQGLGFPDGFVSELAGAERILAWLFIAVSLGFALALGVLGARPSRRANRVAIAAAAILYGVAVAGTAGVDCILRATLMGGGGG